VVRLLIWLTSKPHVTLSCGKHQYIVRYAFWERPYPVPIKHNEINKNIVRALMEKLVASEICTKEEFDERIK